MKIFKENMNQKYLKKSEGEVFIFRDMLLVVQIQLKKYLKKDKILKVNMQLILE